MLKAVGHVARNYKRQGARKEDADARPLCRALKANGARGLTYGGSKEVRSDEMPHQQNRPHGREKRGYQSQRRR